jgi:hypothetical protein
MSKQVTILPKNTWVGWMGNMFSSKKPYSQPNTQNVMGGKSKKRRSNKKGGWTIQKKKASSKSNTIQKRNTIKTFSIKPKY